MGLKPARWCCYAESYDRKPFQGSLRSFRSFVFAGSDMPRPTPTLTAILAAGALAAFASAQTRLMRLDGLPNGPPANKAPSACLG